MTLSKSLTIFLAIGLGALSMAMVQGPSSSGSPPSHTGAPGEKTCATAGCHDDHPVNGGNARIELQVGTSGNYDPKKNYPLTIRVTDSGVTRFGFQVVAISEVTGKSVGKFVITDAVKTQLITNLKNFTDREYATYTIDGTDAVSAGKGEWTLQWKAPAKDAGSVHFYVSAVSSNDNENDKGDFVYVSDWLLNETK